MQQINLEQELEKAHLRTSDIVDFARELWLKSEGFDIRPKMHQSIRIYEAVKNGIKRMFFSDTTSAGKTFPTIAIFGMTDKHLIASEGRRARALFIGPKQALESALAQEEIDEYTKALDLPSQNHVRIKRNNLRALEENNFNSINFGKISIAPENNIYLNALSRILPSLDLVVVDECHNLKNIFANRTSAFVNLVEKTLKKRFLMLSASAIPNRLEDAGFLMYMMNLFHFNRIVFTKNLGCLFNKIKY